MAFDSTDDAPSFLPSLLPGGVTAAGVRKRVLLGILARNEAARLGLEITPAQVEQTARWHRARFDMLRREDVTDFLRFAGLAQADFSHAMRTFTTLGAVERAHRLAIDAEVPGFAGMLSVREWMLRKETRS